MYPTPLRFVRVNSVNFFVATYILFLLFQTFVIGLVILRHPNFYFVILTKSAAYLMLHEFQGALY